MKIKVLIFSILLTTLLPAQKPRIAYKEGIIAHAKNKNTEAVKLLTIAINSGRKKYRPAYILRGDSYEKLGNKIYAVDDYIYAYDYSIDKISLGNKIARMLFDLNSYSQSLIFIKKTLAIDSTNFMALKLKAIDQVYLGDFENALLTCDYASTLQNDAELTYAKALASDSLNLTDYAFAYYRKAIIQDSLFKPTYLAYTRLLVKERFYDKALQVITAASELFSDTEIYRLRAQIYAKKGLLRKQINDITKELTLNKSNYSLLFKRAILYDKLSMFNVALVDVNRFLEHEPNNLDALFLKAGISQKIYNKDVALKCYQKYISLSNNKIKIDKAKQAIYILKKETHEPVIYIKTPPQPDINSISVGVNDSSFVLKAQCVDESKISKVIVNGDLVDFGFISNNRWVFSKKIYLDSVKNVEITVVDEYNNSRRQVYKLIKAEQDPPIVKVSNNFIINDSIIRPNKSRIKLIGYVYDKSPIKSCIVNDKPVKLVKSSRGYQFSEYIDLASIDTLKIITTDFFSNKSEKKYLIQHSDSLNDEVSELGKTWVLLIASDTINNQPLFPVIKLKDSLINVFKCFDVDSILVFSSYTKEKLERKLMFDLPKNTLDNRVNSLLMYFIGPGMTVDDFTYWIVKSSDQSQIYASLNTSLYRTIFETLSHVKFKTLISESVLMGRNILDTTHNLELKKDFVLNKIPDRGEFVLGVKVTNWRRYSSPILQILKSTVSENRKHASLFDLLKYDSGLINFGKIKGSFTPIFPLYLTKKKDKCNN